jgi:ubiquinone/menaquinone biosynthesis C-methylase UbiE
MKSFQPFMRVILVLAVLILPALPAASQEKSLSPGINKQYDNPDVKAYVKKFTAENREVFAKREKILAVCNLKPGTAAADVGAGTGAFTLLIAKAVGPTGKVYAVDIVPKFIEHIEKACKEKEIANVTGVLCTPTSTKLPAKSVDLVLICDAYHHFEYPFKTMKTVHAALRPGGRLVFVDFKRIPGVSPESILNHVRAGQETVTKEIVASGFRLADEPLKMKDNYCLVFEKVEKP